MRAKIIFSLFIFFLSANLFSQTTDWLWGSQAISSGGGGGEGYSVCNDPSGNVFVTGCFNTSNLTFGSTTLTGVLNTNLLFVAKFDTNGNALWAKKAGTAGAFGHSVCTDQNGNVFVTGWYADSITFGSVTLTASGPWDIFIVKYDSNGNVLWAQNAGGTADDYSESIASDSSGNIFITGFTYSPTITFGSVTLTNTGNTNVIIAKYDNNGNALWARNAGGGNDNEGSSVSVDVVGNAFITGFFFSASITFGTTTLTNAGGSDMFIVKYDGNGNVVWAKSSGGNSAEAGSSVSTDPGKNIYVTGFFYSTSVVFGSTTLSNAGSYDAYIAKYDANGNVVWAKEVGGTGGDYGNCISSDQFGNVYVSGGFMSNTLNIGSYTLTRAVGSVDPLFLIKYSSSGNVLCTSSLSSGADDLNGLSTDNFGNAYVGGDFEMTNFPIGPDTLLLQGQEDIFVAKYKSNCGFESVNELISEETISIFPNPSNGIFTLNSKIQDGEIFIYNILGEIIFHSEINSSLTEINLSADANGIYFVSVKTEKESFTRKIIIQ